MLRLKFLVLGLVVSSTIIYGMGEPVSKDLLFVIAVQGDGKVKNKLRQTCKDYANRFCMNNAYFVMNLNMDCITQRDREIILFKTLWIEDKGNDKEKNIKQAIINRYKPLDKDVVRVGNLFSLFNSKYLEDTFFENEVAFEKVRKTKKYMMFFYTNFYDTVSLLADEKTKFNNVSVNCMQCNYPVENAPIMEVLPFMLCCNNYKLTKLFLFIMSVHCEEWNNDKKRVNSFTFLLRIAMAFAKKNIFTELVKEDPFKIRNICSIQDYQALYNILATKDNAKYKKEYLSIFANESKINNPDVHSDSECAIF